MAVWGAEEGMGRKNVNTVLHMCIMNSQSKFGQNASNRVLVGSQVGLRVEVGGSGT